MNFLVVEPSKIIFLIQKYSTQKEEIILLYIGYHRTPPKNTTHVKAALRFRRSHSLIAIWCLELGKCIIWLLNMISQEYHYIHLNLWGAPKINPKT